MEGGACLPRRRPREGGSPPAQNKAKGRDHAPLPTSGFLSTFADGTVGGSYRIQTTTSLVDGAWTDYTNFTYAEPTVVTIGTTNDAVPARFYRAVSP
jgi:hypothetical protein